MDKKNIVIKIGTNVVITHRDEVDLFRLNKIAEQILKLQKMNFKIVLVVSGAVAVGLQELKLNPKSKLDKQIAAGVGQARLFSQLHSIFTKKNIKLSQLLLTQQYLENKPRKRQIRAVINNTLNLNIIPVLNENDVLSLYSFGGNDFLAEKVAILISASFLIILTDVDGFLDLSPNSALEDIHRADVIPKIGRLTDELKQKIIPTTTKNGIGGMKAKLEVAVNLQQKGIKTIIANGKKKDILTKLLINKEKLGTYFTIPRPKRIPF